MNDDNTLNLPDELAPKLREAAERLIAEVGRRPYVPTEDEPRLPRRKCWACGKPGPMSLHHLANGKVVHVHKRCHRKLHGQAGGGSKRYRSKKGKK